jgi:Ca2+-binding RTX toxin-like protein
MMLIDATATASMRHRRACVQGPGGSQTDVFNLDLANTPGSVRARSEWSTTSSSTSIRPRGERDTRFPDDLARVAAGIPSDGDDVIFGNLGNNWIVGGSGRDHIWGGFGFNVLNADDNHLTTVFTADPIANDREDPYQSYPTSCSAGRGATC